MILKPQLKPFFAFLLAQAVSCGFIQQSIGGGEPPGPINDQPDELLATILSLTATSREFSAFSTASKRFCGISRSNQQVDGVPIRFLKFKKKAVEFLALSQNLSNPGELFARFGLQIHEILIKLPDKDQNIILSLIKPELEQILKRMESRTGRFSSDEEITAAQDLLRFPLLTTESVDRLLTKMDTIEDSETLDSLLEVFLKNPSFNQFPPEETIYNRIICLLSKVNSFNGQALLAFSLAANHLLKIAQLEQIDTLAKKQGFNEERVPFHDEWILTAPKLPLPARAFIYLGFFSNPLTKSSNWKLRFQEVVEYLQEYPVKGLFLANFLNHFEEDSEALDFVEKAIRNLNSPKIQALALLAILSPADGIKAFQASKFPNSYLQSPLFQRDPTTKPNWHARFACLLRELKPRFTSIKDSAIQRALANQEL